MLMTKLTLPLRSCSRRRPADRRGVLLLVILGMLAMFALIGLAFVMLTGHARRGAEAIRRKEFYAENSQKFADEAILQVLRGSTNPNSVLQNHSLLEDMYGANTVEGEVNSVTDLSNVAKTGGDDSDVSAVKIIIDTADSPELDTDLEQSSHIGEILTFTTGVNAGQSVRIIGWESGRLFTVSPTVIPSANDQFIINSHPFSGTGFGYYLNAAANAPQLSVQYTSWLPLEPGWTPYGTPTEDPLQALFPNPTVYHEDCFLAADAYDDLSGPGGANEDYDAPDYQNMLLALQEVDGDVPSPSLHRPALIRFWNEQRLNLIDTSIMVGDQAEVALVCPHLLPLSAFNRGAPDVRFAKDFYRRISLRPSQGYHPDFTGSNPNFWPLWDGATVGAVQLDLDDDGTDEFVINQPEWDVDNDGDGIKDSIWVDLGLPIQTTKDGRQYKPLAAILCVDLDGRLNLNAHGNAALMSEVPPTDCNTGTGSIIAGGTAPAAADRGQGAGVAEVDLQTLLGDPAIYQRLLRGDTQTPGRYGKESLFAAPGSDTIRAAQWLPDPPAGNSAPTTLDPPYDFMGYPYDYLGIVEGSACDFGSPVDLKGGMQIALDWRGQPVYQTVDYTGFSPLAPLTGQNDALIGQPYELDLSPDGPRGLSMTSPDAPFSPPELERLLRPYDIDTMNLPDRLISLIDPSGTDPDWWWDTNHRNRKVTTESSDVASVPCAVTPGLLDDVATDLESSGVPPYFQDPSNPAIASRSTIRTWLNQFPTGLPQILAARLLTEGMSHTNVEANLTTIGNDLLGRELMAGLPININRRLRTRTPAAYTDNQTDRQTLARNLYVTAMLLLDRDTADEGINNIAWRRYFPDTLITTLADQQDYSAQMLAQWAINAVDFRCNDSVMTPFEYDADPFVDNVTPNGPAPWNVDDLVTTIAPAEPNSRIVWGCTRPELLITETVAFHDRRTEDTTSDPSGKAVGPNPTDDKDFDQRVPPEGSMFIELYNPSAETEPVPWDLAHTNSKGIDLTKRVNNSSPVWRIGIVGDTGDQNTAAHNHENATMQANLDPDTAPATFQFDRAAYFKQPNFPAAGTPTDVAAEFYAGGSVTPIVRPGTYAVIGSGEPGETTATTYIGTSTDPNPRRIELAPKSTTGAATEPDQQVYAYEEGAANDSVQSNVVAASLDDRIKVPVALIVDRPHRLSISEPTGTSNYKELPTYQPGTNDFNPIFDMPIDKMVDPILWDEVLKNDGTMLRFAVVHLQRLADPSREYDQYTNRYRTIDSMAVDLTVFNSLETPAVPANADEGFPGVGVAHRFLSRERGANNGGTLWVQDAWENYTGTGSTTSNGSTPTAAAATNIVDNLVHTLGSLNSCYPQLTPVTIANYVDCPQNPFAWFAWNNRPYMSKNELALVPFTSSSQLLKIARFPTAATAAPFPYEETLEDMSTGVGTYSERQLKLNNELNNQHFAHLLNFFNSTTTMGPPTNATELQQVLDYVRVPSRFIKTREQIVGTGATYEQYRELTDRREPGRVNLNTVNDTDVWNGITNVGTMPTPVWDPANYPTRFPNPFRSSQGLGMIPTQNLMNAVNREVNATILRENGGTPFFQGATHGNYDDTDRNPYFRYLPLTRLGNTAGTRSNVYAVWVTIGYFEVEPVVYEDQDNNNLDDVLFCTQADFPDYSSRIYPDGVRLGQEVGADSGEVKRNRAFYMLDRSIPVGFRRGEDLNVKDTLLIQRQIE